MTKIITNEIFVIFVIMRWKAKTTLPEYKEGSTRLVRFFAWLPVYISGDMVWLETYEVLQLYQTTQYDIKVDSDSKELVFTIGTWINLSKRTCK